MIEKYGYWVIQWRYFVIIAIVIAVGLTTQGLPLRFETDYRAFFSEENPQLLAFEEIQNVYTKNDNVMFVFAPADGKVFTPETLTAVEWLTNEAWQIPYSTRVDSVTNFQHTHATGDELTVEDLITDAMQCTPVELAEAQAIALAEPLLINRLISPTAHVTAVNVTVQLPSEQKEKEVPKVAKFSRDLVMQLEQRYPQIKVYLTGFVMMNNSFPEAAQQDMRTLIPLMYITILAGLWVLLRSLSGTLTTALIVGFSTMAAMGLAGLTGMALTGPSSSAPIVILTLSVADSVHLMVTLRHEMRVNGLPKNEAIIESLRINFQPIFLTSLTTSIGLLSMNFGDVPPFQDLGNIAAVGVVIAFILSITLVPAMIAILPFRPKPEKAGTAHVMDKLGAFVVHQRQKLLWSLSLVVLLLIAFLPRNELNDVFVEYFDESFAFRRATDFTTANLTGLYNIQYSLSSGETSGLSNPAFLRQIEAFGQWYQQQPEVIHINTITDTFKRLNKNMHGDDPNYYRLPENRELAAQYLLLYEMSLPYGLDLNNQINVDKSATRLTVTTKTLSTNEVLALEARAQQWLATHAPNMQAHGASPTLMFAHIGYRNIRGMLLGATIALVLISFILIVVLRSWKFGLLSLIPNLIPTAMAFGVWGLFVGQVGMGLSVVAGLTIGIVVDDTIHYLSKYLRARREKGLAPTEAVRYAFRNVGLALWITSVVLILGFLILSLSHFHVNETMGIITALTIALALFADFLLLPPLLMKLEEKKA